MITNIVENVGVYVPEGDYVMLATTQELHSQLVMVSMIGGVLMLAVLMCLFWLNRLARGIRRIEDHIDSEELGEELEALGL